MRVLFAGTPEVAVPSLQALLASSHEVAAVLTRADAKAGRGNKLTPSPVRVAAEAAGIPVITGNTSDAGVQAEIAALGCEAAAVVAYGHLLRQSALDLMPKGWFNLHFSLLPRWRGAAPLQWALISGDNEVGVSVFQLDPGMDTGPVFATEVVPLHGADSEHSETAGTLLPRLADVGAGLLVKVFDDVAAGTAVGVPQTGEPTLAPKITAELARVDWDRPALEIYQQIQGVTPNPGAWTTLLTDDDAEPIRLNLALPAPPELSQSNVLSHEIAREVGSSPSVERSRENTREVETPVVQGYLPPGQLRVEKKAVWVGTGSQPLRLTIVQPPGKKPMPATDWVRGARLTPDSKLE